MQNYKLKPTETVIVGKKSFDVEIADTPEKRREGLSKANSLSDDEGMLFVFDEVQDEVSFTMAETNIDLDIILRWEALLSVHIKEYHFINNKHKNFRGKSFSRCK